MSFPRPSNLIHQLIETEKMILKSGRIQNKLQIIFYQVFILLLFLKGTCTLFDCGGVSLETQIAEFILKHKKKFHTPSITS